MLNEHTKCKPITNKRSFLQLNGAGWNNRKFWRVYKHTLIQTAHMRSLTDDEVVLIGFEFVAPQVGRVLLKLDGETHVTVGLIAGEEQVWGSGHFTPVCLVPWRHQVQFIVLIIGRGAGTGRLRCWANEVQTIPDLRVQDITLIITKPAGGGQRGKEREFNVMLLETGKNHKKWHG